MPRGKYVWTDQQRANLKAAGARRALPVADRFWPKVAKAGPDECWEWTGSKNKGGYGLIYADGRVENAHRVSLRLSGVNLPTSTRQHHGAVVDHICKNVACVNPAHLRVVSQRINNLENSDSIWAKNKAKTHCDHGHEFTAENIRPNKKYPGMRNCKACSVLHAQAEKWAKRLGMPPRPEWLAKREAA